MADQPLKEYASCKQCASPFRARSSKRGQMQIYCSRQCRVDAWRIHPDRATAKRLYKAKVRRLAGVPTRADIAKRSAAKREAIQKGYAIRCCKQCGGVMDPDRVGYRGAPSICLTCSKANAASQKRTRRSMERAQVKAAKVEHVDPFKVFDRDGWRCHLCGCKTPKDKRGTYHPKAPELDHIVPLSKGGEHSYRNTACACRQCNASKSDKILGQPSLLAA